MAIMIRGSNLQFFISMIFVFSFLYTMYFYYQSSSSSNLEIKPIDDVEDTTKLTKTVSSSGNTITDFLSSIVTGVSSNVIDFMLELLSVLSPFILVKGMLYVITPIDLYTFINLILLRPIGWIGTYITTDYVINKIRGVSE